MADVLLFDEINKLEEYALPYKKRSIPFEEYFAPMGISQEQKDERVSFAYGLADKILYLFAMAEVRGKFDMFSRDWLENEIYNTYMSYVTMFFGEIKIDDYIRKHIMKFAETIADNTSPYIEQPNYVSTSVNPTYREYEWEYEDENDTKKRKNGILPIWYTSKDRSDFIAENEANDIMNYEEFRDAIEEGYSEKTWMTMRDNKVRDDHADADGQTVPIDEYFVVGDEYGMFPGDTENLSASNTVNCRCWLEYS